MRWLAPLRHPLAVGAALGYLALRLARHWRPQAVPALASAYLADLLALPLLLSVALAAHRALVRPGGTLPAAWLAGAWLAVSVWFEVLLPRWSARATADPLDALAYGLGTLAFGYWVNRPPAR